MNFFAFETKWVWIYFLVTAPLLLLALHMGRRPKDSRTVTPTASRELVRKSLIQECGMQRMDV